jgi:DNA-binding beta-propeller fold protein YncE
MVGPANMKNKTLNSVLLGIALVHCAPLFAGEDSALPPYAVQKIAKVGGDGGFDYVYADAAGRRLYIPRPGASPRVSVFDLDTLEAAGEIPNVNARDVCVDPVSHHAFASSKPVAMWNTDTLAVIKAIGVEGRPDGILFDPFNSRVWVFSHSAPNATVIDSRDGSVVGTLDLGGEPEQAVTDGKGKIYVDIEDKDQIAVVDAKALAVTGRYDFAGKGGGPAGLALDAKNHILFATCHKPATIVIVNADSGAILAALPIGQGTDGALFNPATLEAFSSNGADGTLTVVKESSPAEFMVEQTVPTKSGARTSTLDAKTNRVVLITADFGPAPSPPPNGGWVRRPMIPGSFSVLTVAR